MTARARASSSSESSSRSSICARTMDQGSASDRENVSQQVKRRTDLWSPPPFVGLEGSSPLPVRLPDFALVRKLLVRVAVHCTTFAFPLRLGSFWVGRHRTSRTDALASHLEQDVLDSVDVVAGLVAGSALVVTPARRGEMLNCIPSGCQVLVPNGRCCGLESDEEQRGRVGVDCQLRNAVSLLARERAYRGRQRQSPRTWLSPASSAVDATCGEEASAAHSSRLRLSSRQQESSSP